MKCREIQPTMRTFIVRALSFSAVAALTLNPALTPVVASDYRAMPVATDGQMNARFVSLGIGKSIVIDLPREIKDVLVADPKIANAIVRSTQRAYIIGAAVGQTNIVFFDSTGAQIAALTSRSSVISTCAPRYGSRCRESRSMASAIA
jgi:pilus assembly protein CpaC